MKTTSVGPVSGPPPADRAGSPSDTVYVCARGHSTPYEAIRRPMPVIACPAPVGRQMACGAQARLREGVAMG